MAAHRHRGPARRRRRGAALGRKQAAEPTPSLGQEPPLTPEYQTIYEANLADMVKGGQGIDPTYSCVSPGMPRVMIGYSALEFVVTPRTHLHSVRA